MPNSIVSHRLHLEILVKLIGRMLTNPLQSTPVRTYNISKAGFYALSICTIHREMVHREMWDVMSYGLGTTCQMSRIGIHVQLDREAEDLLSFKHNFLPTSCSTLCSKRYCCWHIAALPHLRELASKPVSTLGEGADGFCGWLAGNQVCHPAR